jgi:hypothetical protein
VLWKIQDPASYKNRAPRLGTPVQKRRISEIFSLRNQTQQKKVTISNNNRSPASKLATK